MAYNYYKYKVLNIVETLFIKVSRGVSQLELAKESITEAFLALLNDKDFEKISVTEIVQKSGFSRSTFYLHYMDKYDLLEQTRYLLNTRFLSFYERETKSAENVTYHLCLHIIKHRSFYNMEFSDPHAMLKLSNQLAQHLYNVFKDWDYATFASHGTIGYLNQWLESGFTASPVDASEKLLKIGYTNWVKEIDVADI